MSLNLRKRRSRRNTIMISPVRQAGCVENDSWPVKQYEALTGAPYLKDLFRHPPPKLEFQPMRFQNKQCLNDVLSFLVSDFEPSNYRRYRWKYTQEHPPKLVKKQGLKR